MQSIGSISKPFFRSHPILFPPLHSWLGSCVSPEELELNAWLLSLQTSISGSPVSSLLGTKLQSTAVRTMGFGVHIPAERLPATPRLHHAAQALWPSPALELAKCSPESKPLQPLFPLAGNLLSERLSPQHSNLWSNASLEGLS